MKTLELKHLAPYLPYGLKCRFDRWDEKLVGITYEADGDHRAQMLIGERKGEIRYWTPKLENAKPILRPLSDLTKEIEHDGEKFVPDAWFATWHGKLISGGDLEYDTQLGDESNHLRFVSILNDYDIMQKLFEWHFDVFGLIEQGLAIDKNTL